MGFWHTGYIDHASDTYDGRSLFSHRWLLGDTTIPRVPPTPTPPQFACTECGAAFVSDGDVRLHRFADHARMRPTLVFQGRECGRNRLMITRATRPEDWVVVATDRIVVNGRTMDLDAARTHLADQRSGVAVVSLHGEGRPREFTFEFALATDADLQGVEDELSVLIDGRELTRASIGAFIERAKKYSTAQRYLAGIAQYLFAAMHHESGEPVPRATRGFRDGFSGSARMLADFDRPAAEAICGLVAYHFNQFDTAAQRTKSMRVAGTSLRFAALLNGRDWADLGRLDREHAGLDRALSDELVEGLLMMGAIAIDGTGSRDVEEVEARLETLDHDEELKPRLLLAEHYLAIGDSRAIRHADALQDNERVKKWLVRFGQRIEGRFE